MNPAYQKKPLHTVSLQKLERFLGKDIQNEPFHDVCAELRELGYDLTTIQSRIDAVEKRKISETELPVGSGVMPVCLASDHNDCKEVFTLLDLVGHKLPSVVTSAVTELRAIWRNNRNALVRCLTQLTRTPTEPKELEGVYAALERNAHAIRVLAYRNFSKPLQVTDVLKGLRRPQARLYKIVKSRNTQIYAAIIDCEGKDFVAALLEYGNNRFLQVINSLLTADDCVESVAHELNHSFDIICSIKTVKPITSMESHKNTIVPFAQAQKQVDPDDKDLVARWIAEELRLSNGAGVFLDAGSQCMVLWKAIREQIRKNLYSHLAVSTNNFLVLEQWVQDQTIQMQGNTVETVGDVFDVAHLAFYGSTAKPRLMEGNFRPTVYIGTSGIEFSDESILFGYHQGSMEGDFKQLLFQCPARSRVILATPPKIGNAGGRVFDLLKMDGLNVTAPIFLVTTNPPKGTASEKTFQEAQNALRQERMQNAIKKKGIKFTWVTVDRDSLEVPKASETFTVPD